MLTATASALATPATSAALCPLCQDQPGLAGLGGLCGPCWCYGRPPPPKPARLPPRDDSSRPRCLHCQVRPAMRTRCTTRGLCWSCYGKPAIRERYPTRGKFNRRGVGLGFRRSRLPAEPTIAPPGTEAKVLVMMARAARGESLFHPEDG